jgi:hypothetical protein
MAASPKRQFAYYNCPKPPFGQHINRSALFTQRTSVRGAAKDRFSDSRRCQMQTSASELECQLSLARCARDAPAANGRSPPFSTTCRRRSIGH